MLPPIYWESVRWALSAVIPTDHPTHPGGCLCGSVRFAVKGQLRPVVACHCRECRKQSGHFSAMTGVPLEHFTLLSGKALTWYRASTSVQRGFCATCGSKLFWQPDEAGWIAVAAGAFDGPLGVTLAQHIYCAEQGDYYDIADGLPQEAGWNKKPG